MVHKKRDLTAQPIIVQYQVGLAWKGSLGIIRCNQSHINQGVKGWECRIPRQQHLQVRSQISEGTIFLGSLSVGHGFGVRVHLRAQTWASVDAPQSREEAGRL